ncbi:MAG TPA: asparagine synthase (glutamine-hydrolyzing) [Saprospiraceae bacterium]|nr:asparagine synthase (glutamine-hydrolyzing) [Saprospiraceae bacterium]
MCGLDGFYRFNSVVNEEDVKVVKQMTSHLAHRGPDAEGIFHHGHCALGHRRLSIIDLDKRSNQPFTDHSGRYTIVFNGQIYNYNEIKADLTEYPFRTTSDTEVILAGYAKWGAQCLGKMNGMFALAIYDTVEQTLFIARDRLGVKPLYYYMNSKVFLFASEIRALLSAGLIPKKVSHTALQEYLFFQAPACPNSILEDIHQLPPAQYAYVREGQMHASSYWTFGATAPEQPDNYALAIKDVRHLLQESVRRRMISDVPLGAFLSGGIDSSAIVELMSQVEQGVNTFSIVFQEADYDESQYSDLIANKYATHHHKLLLSPQQFLEEVPNALNAMDSPSADGMNTYVVSKLTRQAGVTVAMSGLGGDELFAGYHNFKVWKNMKRYGFFMLPAPLRSVLTASISTSAEESRRERMAILSGSDGILTKAYPAFRQVMGSKLVASITRDKGKDPMLFERNGLNDGFGILSQYSIAELTNYTRNVLLKDTDQFSMASGLEVREPFFDHLLVDYVMRLPDKWKLGSTPKRLLSDAMGELLPNEIVMRKKKGFLFPWAHWLKNELQDFAAEHIEFLADRQEFDGDEVRKVWLQFKKNASAIPWVYIWQLVALSHWLRKNL